MKVYPWDEVIPEVLKHIRNGANAYQQFNCAHCGTKQTMDVPNRFFTSGNCEECGKTTDIVKDGCNYLLHLQFGAKEK
jgi:rRNA maturation protein Nop10